MRAVDYRDWPKQRLFGKETSLVAYIEGEFDAFVKQLSATPKTVTERATKTFPQIKYRSIFLILSNGAPAALTEYLDKPGKLDLNLQVVRDEFAYDDDYAEVITELGVEPEKVHKFEGNFTWLPNRKAKKARSREEPMPDPAEFWSQVSVAPAPPSRKVSRSKK